MWCGTTEQAQTRQLPLDVVWVVPGEIRKHFSQEQLQHERFGVSAYLNWSASHGLKNPVRIVLENGYSCCAPASLLAAFSEVLRKLILAQASQEQFSSGKEITIHLREIPSITNAGLFNVISYIQNGQIKFLETELENVLTAANDLRVISLVSSICEEMAIRILENTSSAITLLYIAVACLPPQSQHRNMVVDSAARKFPDVVMNAEFLKLSFEMLYALISSPVIQGAEWVMEIYKAVLYWLRNNTELIYFAPALLDNINFKLIINTIENRREIIQKSMEVSELGPIVQIFLMDAIYAQFLDDLTSPPSRNQSFSSSIYTISGVETVNAPTPNGGPLGLAPSPLGSYIIPPFNSRSPMTTKSISNETTASVDRNWRPAKQLPTGSGNSRNQPVGYQSNAMNCANYKAQEKTANNTGDTGRRLWSEVLANGPKYNSKSGNVSARNNPANMGPERSGPVHSGSVHGGPVHNGPIRLVHSSLPNSDSARGRLAFSYSTIVANGGGGGVDKDGTETAIASSPTFESVEVRTSSSQESTSSSKRRRKFEQIPLRTEPPKSRKELRKERQARERAEKK
ncbi:BTB And C-terminal Kelch family protein [Acanthocheilonema viteae]